MRTTRTNRAGFSLVEMLIVALILSAALAMLSMIGRSSERAYQNGTTAAQLEVQAAQAVERVVLELRPIALASLPPALVPGVGAATVQYVQAVGYEAGAVVQTPLRQLGLEYAEGELDDGLDNNSNGLVDEGRIVLIENLGTADERRLVLTRWVAEQFEGELPNGVDDNGNGLEDERGFHVERVGNALLVRLTLQRRDAEGRLMTRVARTTVELRN
jgi:prepilin-type N-terminal cleavage/methylation domain-containing protein